MIASTARTPIGALQGNLKTLTEQKLGSNAMLAAIENSGIDSKDIDMVVVGTAKQTSMPSNVARHTMLVAKMPVEIPAYSVHRQSASSVQAMVNGFLQIKCNNADIVLAGGTESMSQIPLEIYDARYKFDENTKIVFDPISEQIKGAQPEEKYGELTIESISRNLRNAYNINDDEISAYAESSLKKAKGFKDEKFIVPTVVKLRKSSPVYEEDELVAEPKEIAEPADCAAMNILISEGKAKELELDVLGEIASYGVSAGDPTSKGILGIDAIKSALDKAEIDIKDVDIIEINEISAAQCLATHIELEKMGLSKDEIKSRVNSNGGSLATGNPWGASGAILVNKIMHELEEGNKEIGLIVTPAEGGQAMAMIIRRNK